MPVVKYFGKHWAKLILGLVLLSGCEAESPLEVAEKPTSAKIPPRRESERSLPNRMATHFMEPPQDLYQAPKLVEIPVKVFPGAHAIWGATGRDDRGHIWLGVTESGGTQPSAHLLEYIPQLNEVLDRGNVLDQLRRSSSLSRERPR